MKKNILIAVLLMLLVLCVLIIVIQLNGGPSLTEFPGTSGGTGQPVSQGEDAVELEVDIDEEIEIPALIATLESLKSEFELQESSEAAEAAGEARRKAEKVLGLSGEDDAEAVKTEISIEGTVVDELGLPVAGATIFIAPRIEPVLLGSSDDDGKFAITKEIDEGLWKNAKLVYAQHDAFAKGWAPLVETEDGYAPIRIVLQMGGTIEGMVTVGGEPAEGVEVQTDSYNTIGKAVTDANGWYRIEQVAPGTVLVLAVIDQSRMLDQPAIVENAEVTIVDFDFSGANSSVIGKITVNGERTPRWHIRLFVNTHDDLREMFVLDVRDTNLYVFENVPAGKAEMILETRTEEGTKCSRRVVFDVPENEIVEKNVDISLGTAVSGRIFLPEEVVDGVVLALDGDISIPELSAEALTALEPLIVASGGVQSGRYRFDGLEPGTYTVVVLAYPELPDSEGDALTTMFATAYFDAETVELEEGEESVLDLYPEL